MIALRGATVVHPGPTGDRAVLDDISVTVDDGEWLALAGPNGSGKTTLLAVMAGLVPLARGTLTVDPPGGAALLLQEPDNQLVTTTVRRELALSVPEGTAPARARERCDEAAERFALGDLLARNPHRLSGGEKQRLALATVWLQAPRLVLLDEPVSHLDAVAADRCVDLVRELHGAGASVVWATPGGMEVGFAARAVCLAGGKVAYGGAPSGLAAWARQRGIGLVESAWERLAAGLAPYVDEPPGAGAEPLARVLAARVGANALEAPGNPASGARAGRAGDDDVAFEAATLGYGAGAVLDDVSVAIGRGECVGLVGGNGAGKTTLLLAAAGVLHPSRGRVHRASARARSRTHRDGRQHVVYLPQSPERMFFAETVREELVFGLRRLGRSSSDAARAAADALARVGLDPPAFLGREPWSLSLGEMRRVAIAVAEALAPDVLLLDEPTAGLDRAGEALVGEVLAARRREGRTTVVASHDAGWVCETCDRVIALEDGRVALDVVVAQGFEPGLAWPAAARPPILALQDELAAHGTDVAPRALRVDGLVGRLGLAPARS